MVTLKEIANATGVSRATVGFVLSGDPRAARFTEDTRTRVREAARALGYRPNASARATRTGRFGSVGLLLSNVSWRSALSFHRLNGIQDALVARDLHLTIGTFPDETLLAEGFAPKLLREWMADGLLLNYSVDIPEPFYEQLRRHQLPSVWLNADRESDCARPDDEDGGRRAAEFLLGLGHRRVAYVHHGSSHYSTAGREAGYRRAMAAAGLPPRSIHVDLRTPVPEWATAPGNWFTAPDRPTALIAYNPYVSQRLLHAAALTGVRVPADLSVVTFDDDVLDMVGLPATTLLIPERAVGRAAVEMLLEKIEHPDRVLPCRALPFAVEVRATTAPPRP
jgi:LacI family transcriptional regulator